MVMFRFSLSLLLSILPFTVSAQTPQKEGTATIAGTVTLNGEPARGVPVGLQMQNPSTPMRPGPASAKTDANGRFRITGVAAGQYIVGALAPGFVTNSSQDYRQSYGLQGKTINVSGGETVENVELALKRGGVITGRITDANGEPVVETNIRITKATARDANSQPPPPINTGAYRTDDRGVYRIYGLAAGKYKVSVGMPTRDGSYSGFQTSRTFIPETFHPDTTDEALAKVIELEEGQEVADVDIKAAELKRAYEIAGRVVDAESGKPIAGIGIGYGTFNQSGRMNGWMSGNWQTDANGEFQIMGVRPGKHGVFIGDREGKSELFSDPTPVEVIDSDVASVEVRAQRGAAISGMVVIEGTTDPAVLAKRSQINLNTYSASGGPSLSASRNIRTNSDGSFRFGGLPAGKIRISSYSNQPGLTLLRAEQNGAAVKDLTIEVHPGEQVTGVRLVFGYGSAVVRGQVKIIGGPPPEGIRLMVSLRQAGNTVGSPNYSALLDDRNQFLLRNVVPGDYELRIGFTFSGPPPPREVMAKLSPLLNKAKQNVTASNAAEAQVTVTIDLSQEGNQ